MKTMADYLVDEYGIDEEDARRTVKEWLNRKSNKELWIEEQERMEEENE